MKLENIGFYTLSNERVKQVHKNSPLWRCELILTDRCNFKCPYCRGLTSDISGDLPLWNAKLILQSWFLNGLKNVRFSGGEPTLYKGLQELVHLCYYNDVEHIAISTNGSADFEFYRQLFYTGVNDFSISLDACCSSFGKKMSGGISGTWEKVIDNIQKISELTYVTVGVVITEENVNSLNNIILFADSLGVSDIRIISAAQYNQLLYQVQNIPSDIIKKYPILKYRVNNIIKRGRNVRGIQENDSHKCGLVLDDMAVAKGKHFPCIIYMREGGEAIGDINCNMREDRYRWFVNHNNYNDPICQKNCLDVCIDYNNTYKKYHGEF